MSINVSELERVLAYCRDHPKQHDQEIWLCGTTACYAGYTALLNGWRPYGTLSIIGTSRVKKGGEVRYVREVAAEILGLSNPDAEHLFINCPSFEKLELAVKDLINRESINDDHVGR